MDDHLSQLAFPIKSSYLLMLCLFLEQTAFSIFGVASKHPVCGETARFGHRPA